MTRDLVQDSKGGGWLVVENAQILFAKLNMEKSDEILTALPSIVIGL